MKVHALTLDRGGCFHYRIRQPLTAMRDLGHWTSWGSGMDLETWDRADVIVGQYLHNERTMTDWVRWHDETNKVLVWEADDDITTVHESEAHGSAYDDPETLPRMIHMLRYAHLVTVTTEALADVYRPYNPNVVVLPNCVPDWLTEVQMPALGTDEKLAIGYTGSASHFHDFREWSPIFATWQRYNSYRTHLKLYGHNGKPANSPRTWKISAQPWMKSTEEYLRSMEGAYDIGVTFLSDTQFNRGKSPIKAMEYAALGIPCVATDHPVYRDTIVNGVTGFLCKTQGQWIDALRILANDPVLRQDMGHKAREHAKANFVQSLHIKEWEDAYRITAKAAVGVEL